MDKDELILDYEHGDNLGIKGHRENNNQKNISKIISIDNYRKKHKKKNNKGIFKKLFIALISMALIIIVVFGAFKFFVYSAKQKLYSKVNNQIQTTINDEQTPLSSEAEEESIDWKDGYISYNGKTYAYNEDILTFLIMGIDKDGEADLLSDGIDGGQADSLFLLVMNPHDESINVLSINRNTMTLIDVYDENGEFVTSGIGQICLQHGYGDGRDLSCKRCVKAVRNLYRDIPIAGYASINMGAIGKLNDAIGGVSLEILYDIPGIEGHNTLSKGDYVTLVGDDAYWYTKYRDINVFDSVSERQDRQKQYLSLFIPKLKQSILDDPSVIVSIYNAIEPYVVTDLGIGELTYIGTKTAGYKFDTDNIYEMEGTTIVGESGFEEFTCDEDALYDLIVKIFYEEVNK